MKTVFYTITLLVLTVLVGGWAVTHAQASWYNSDWDYRQKITIDSSQVQSSLTDFPVYVDLSTMSSGFFSNVQSDGGDIRVTKADGTTEVAREVVSLDTASSTGELHFKAPSVSSSTDTEFYVYYGNSSANDYADSDTYGAENVWTNSQAGVWHLGEETGDAIDSTSNNNDGTTNGGVTQGVGGQVGQAYDFDGSDDYIEVTDDASLGITKEVTMMLWLKGEPSGDYVRVIEKGENEAYELFGANSGKFQPWVRINAGDMHRGNLNTLSSTEWHHVAANYDSATGESEIYVDGVLKNTDSISSQSINTTSATLRIATEEPLSGSDKWKGEIDNVRISDTARSTDWISTEYTNQNSPTTFYTVGSEETESSQVVMESSNYQIQRDSINSGGIDVSTSSNYAIRDTVGEQATGRSTSTNYTVRAGYRQMAESSIAVSAPASVTLPSLGGVVGGTSETIADLTVTTDSPGGYELKVRATTSPALASSEDSFADYAAGSNPDYSFQIASSESSFGYTPEGADVADGFLDDGTSCGTGSQDSQSACWRGFATTDRVIAESTDNNQPSGTETTLRLRAESGEDNIQTSGQYDATIVVTGVAL